MKALEKIQLFFTLNNRESPQYLVEKTKRESQQKNLSRLILIEDYFNSSYYGDPFAYDWNNSDFNEYKRGG